MAYKVRRSTIFYRPAESSTLKPTHKNNLFKSTGITAAISATSPAPWSPRQLKNPEARIILNLSWSCSLSILRTPAGGALFSGPTSGLATSENRSLGIKIAVTLVVAMPGAIMIAQANRWIFSSIEAKVEEQMGKERGIALRRDDAGNLLIALPRAQIGEAVAQAEEAVPQSVLIAPAPTSLDQWKMTFDLAIGRYFLLLAWAALFLALLAGAQARAAERRGERFRTAAKAAELRSLDAWQMQDIYA